MTRTRIKICGITRPEDALATAEAGADLLGLNLFAGPRKIDFATAARIAHAAPSTVQLVALTSEQTPDAPRPADIEQNWNIKIRTFQMYGPFNAHSADCSYWPVWPVKDRQSIAALTASVFATIGGRRPYHAVVLDTAVAGQFGGTGQRFNWTLLADARAAGQLEGVPPIVLAGGLTPDNVGDAIRTARPFAVDVSSGVEVPGKPGVKDPHKIRAFIQAVQDADRALR